MLAAPQEAIAKAQVHVAVVHSVRCQFESVVDAGSDGEPQCIDLIDCGLLAAQCGHLVAACDWLEVIRGDGLECCYTHCLQHFRSVGCATWLQAVAAGGVDSAGAQPLSLYLFGTDAGPENVGMLGRIGRDIAGKRWVMYEAVFCYLHQCHLVIWDLLTVVESFDCGLLGSDSGRQYWSTVATFANVWRSVGMPKKIKAAAVAHFSDVENRGGQPIGPLTASYRTIPGRPLRGRWGTIGSIESHILRCGSSVGAVFSGALGLPLEEAQEKEAKAAAAKARAAAKAKAAAAADEPVAKVAAKKRKIADQEDQEYKQQQKNDRQTAVLCSHDPVWRCVVKVSHVSKEQLTHYLNWAQKAKKLFNMSCDAARPGLSWGIRRSCSLRATEVTR